MARNGISRRGLCSVDVPRDPVPMIDQCIAILTLALFLSRLGTVTFAADRGTPEQRRACTPDAFRLCGEFIPDADRITACLRQKVGDLSPECRVVIAGKRTS